MINLLSLRLLKFFVDFTYYALPIAYWLCKAAFYTLVAVLLFVMIVIIL